mgnify:CR=1 FL=1
MLTLMANRYMPDLMGLSLFVASFYFLTHNFEKYNYFGVFLSSLLLGTRLSYFPLIILGYALVSTSTTLYFNISLFLCNNINNYEVVT